jgi:hypothetical protein
MAAEWQALQSTLAKNFPDYTALAQPEPLTVSETQALLDDDEAVVAFYEGIEKSYAWTLTSKEGFWTEIPTNVKQLRRTASCAPSASRAQENGKITARPGTDHPTSRQVQTWLTRARAGQPGAIGWEPEE